MKVAFKIGGRGRGGAKGTARKGIIGGEARNRADTVPKHSRHLYEIKTIEVRDIASEPGRQGGLRSFKGRLWEEFRKKRVSSLAKGEY